MLYDNDVTDHSDPFPESGTRLCSNANLETDIEAEDLSSQERLVKESSAFRKLLLRVIERQYQQRMTISEHAVLSFIIDRTIRYNKLWERITIPQISNGLQQRDGSWIHHGVNISQRQAHRVIHSLLVKGFIQRREIFDWFHQGEYEYAFSFDNDTLAAFDEDHDYHLP